MLRRVSKQRHQFHNVLLLPRRFGSKSKISSHPSWQIGGSQKERTATHKKTLVVFRNHGGSGENWAQHAQAAGILMAHEDLRLTLLKGSTKPEMLSRAQLAQQP